MTGPLEGLQFTDEEIDHAVRAVRESIGQGDAEAAIVRRVLRAVRAVPARCLNGSLAGHPATIGTNVQGTGVGGVIVRGEVVVSYPVTTTVHTPDGRTDYLWTNTIHSWDPSTEPLRERVEEQLGLPTMVTEDVPDGAAWVIGPPYTGRVPTPATLRGSALGVVNGKIWLSGDTDEMLRADDDGMVVEDGR